MERQHTATKSSITMNVPVDTMETAVLQHTNCLRSRDTNNAKSVVTASKPPPEHPNVPEQSTIPMSQHTRDVNKSVSNGNVSTTNNSPVEPRQNNNQQDRELQR